MAYYLAFGAGSTGNKCDLASAITIQGGDDFALEFETAYGNTGGTTIRPVTEFADVNDLVLSATTLSLQIPGDGTYTFTHGVDYAQRNIYRLIRSGTNLTLEVNGTSVGTQTSGASPSQLRYIGIHANTPNGSSGRGSQNFYYLSVTINGTEVHYYNPSASNGTGLTLPDTTGTNDATLSGFAAGDGHWVFYAASDTTAPTYTTAPAVTATTQNGHTIAATLDEAGTLYGVRLASGAAAPTSAQVKAGQDSTGAAAPEAKSAAAANSASLVFSTGSASTAYDYYIVAEDDEATPNLQASPTLVEATTQASLFISAADDITTESGTSTFTLSGNTNPPTEARLNGTVLTGLTDLGSGVWQYNNPLIADDATATLAVDVDSTTIATTISYANSYPYELVTHGEPNSNSAFFDTQFATNGPIEWGVVTDFDSAIVTVDWAAMDAAEDELNDIDLHSTEVADGESTATLKYFVPESGATGTFDVVVTVGEGVSVISWPFPADPPSIAITWEWGKRHPMTQSRVRMFKGNS